MKLVVIIGTPWISGGNNVLKFIHDVANKLGQETVIHPIDPPAENFWRETYPEDRIVRIKEINREDFLLCPEEFVFMVANLASRTLNYAIINQGMNSVFNSDFGKRNNYKSYIVIYNNAKVILANSNHTKEGIRKLFHVPEEKIINYIVHVDSKFTPSKDKERVITYMSRKNRKFCLFVLNYIEGMFLDWKFTDISNVSSDDVASIMSKSRIFLSFGGPEGFGLPPLEAALCGNKVIGFHGEGGEEYFEEPVFTTVPFYNHYEYLDRTVQTILKYRDTCVTDDVMSDMQIDRLRKKYSEQNATKSIEEMIRRING